MYVDPYYTSDEWRQLHAEILKRDGYRCRYCGRKAHQVDHVRPRKRGGGDVEDNLVACCRWCNTVSRNRSFGSFDAKAAWLNNQREVRDAERKAGKPDRLERAQEVRRICRERGIPLWQFYKEQSQNWKQRPE